MGKFNFFPFRKKSKKVKEQPAAQASSHNQPYSEISDSRKISFNQRKSNQPRAQVENDPVFQKDYDAVPILDIIDLPRGGISVQTEAVGTVQFGIPPETIKDSMRLGIDVPTVYIVPTDRFCREFGPALGINLAEFEFPAYFNFFICQRKCLLVVDNVQAENNIRQVFEETLLGPKHFRKGELSVTHDPDDFDPSYPLEKRPNLAKELEHFRIMPGGKELVVETLLSFCHFQEVLPGKSKSFATPPSCPDDSDDESHRLCSGPQGLDFTEENVLDLNWEFSVDNFSGHVATVFKPGVENPKKDGARVEIFKSPGGAEYIIHDIDDKNEIIGKVKLNGYCQVPESYTVDGFDILDRDIDCDDSAQNKLITMNNDGSEVTVHDSLPPSFYPPSFGVTVLGNSHGFDAGGSTSGYVLWVNGRGLMIDPPPYSTRTLEAEGVRPGSIMGIILTHCHADHDAGAFQKVLNGRPVVVMTTPTIYNSFIRKYSALSGLAADVLKRSHRFRPAIIGRPLKFQGATFHFNYSLHTIPCIGFKVEWRGRSMVFTGDHFNSPEGIKGLEDKGVLSPGRSEWLNAMPLQTTDLLLHEAGVPPIHTPFDVLMKLPQHIKDVMYIVHVTESKLKEAAGDELKVAPTGTKGTIRLDQIEQLRRGQRRNDTAFSSFRASSDNPAVLMTSLLNGPGGRDDLQTIEETDDSEFEFENSDGEECRRASFSRTRMPSFSDDDDLAEKRYNSNSNNLPLVMLRPTSSSDAWFILNLLSSVPFLSSLSYSHAMEVLETCRVDAFCKDDIVVEASRRKSMLCVVWEGSCTERVSLEHKQKIAVKKSKVKPPLAVWFAGDWTGPVSLQPDKRFSGESITSQTHDIIAATSTGVKVITIEIPILHQILMSGSELYRKYQESLATQKNYLLNSNLQNMDKRATIMTKAIGEFSMVELLASNSTFHKISAVQKRHLESISERPKEYQPGDSILIGGEPMDRVLFIVKGTAEFIKNGNDFTSSTDTSTNDMQHMEEDVLRQLMEFNALKVEEEGANTSSTSKSNKIQDIDHQLHQRASLMQYRPGSVRGDFSSGSGSTNRSSISSMMSSAFANFSLDDFLDLDKPQNAISEDQKLRGQFANRMFTKMYSRGVKPYDYVFSRGNFIGDVSVAVDSLTKETIVREEHLNCATLTAGPEGCVVVAISKGALVSFLNDSPGLLMCLLGTQVIV